MTELGELMAEADRAMEAQFNKAAGTEGWHYRDIPWMLEKFHIEFEDLVGAHNIRWVTKSIRNDWEDGPYIRGMLLISPEGMERVAAFNREHHNELS